MAALRAVAILGAGAAIGAALWIAYPRELADRVDLPAETKTESVPAVPGVRLVDAVVPIEPHAELREAATPEPSPSGIRLFLDVRGAQLTQLLQNDLDEFAAEPRDPSWAAGMEAQFQSELVRWPVTLSASYVECRRSKCLVAVVRPPGTFPPQLGGPDARAAAAIQTEIAQKLELIGGPIAAVMSRDGSLVHWHRFHRRCGPDWQCLE